jgi:glycosyltransferase involved in cell wall biosynthesis
MSGKTILILGSFAPSLVHFRGALIAAMVERGHRVVAAAPAMSADVAKKLQVLGAEPRELKLVNASLNPLEMLQSLQEVRSIIREVRPDVLIAYTIKPVILGALAGKTERVPRIVSLITGVGYAFTGGREPKRLVSRVIATPLYRLALSRSDTVIFQNRDDEALFRNLRLLPGHRPAHIVNGSGIDLDHFQPVPLPERPSFLMIARLLKDKGIREFAAAAKRLKADHPDVPIALVGYLDPSPDSLTQAELDDLIAHGIDYKGALDDVRPAIAEASIYVLPSYREGTPRSVLEAMAMGRAVVTTDAPGCRETVENGVNGVLVPPRDAETLYEAMMRFVREPELAAVMGPKSRQLAEAKYDVHKVNAEMLRLAGL